MAAKRRVAVPQREGTGKRPRLTGTQSTGRQARVGIVRTPDTSEAALGPQLIAEHRHPIERAKDMAKFGEERTEDPSTGPKVVKKLLTKWLQSSLTSSTMKMLFDILRTFG